LGTNTLKEILRCLVLIWKLLIAKHIILKRCLFHIYCASSQVYVVVVVIMRGRVICIGDVLFITVVDAFVLELVIAIICI